MLRVIRLRERSSESKGEGQREQRRRGGREGGRKGGREVPTMTTLYSLPPFFQVIRSSMGSAVVPGMSDTTDRSDPNNRFINELYQKKVST